MPRYVISSLLLVFLFSGASRTAVAVTVEELYVAEILTQSQTPLQRTRDAQKGLTQVIKRLSGTSNFADNAYIAAAIRRPDNYYSEYSYAAVERSSLDNPETETETESPPEAQETGLNTGEEAESWQWIRIRFEPNLVSKLLRDAGLPFWGSNRPNVLVWIALGDGSSRQFLSETGMDAFNVELQRQAKLRGLPVYYPLWDLEDTASLSLAEIWGSFLDRIDAASARYQPDTILTARVQQESSGLWSINWNVKLEQRWQINSVDIGTKQQLATTMIDQIAEEFSQRYAIDSSQRYLQMTIEGINNVESYAQAGRYLESLSPVVEVNVVSVEDDIVRYLLSTEGRQDQLVGVIELDQRMTLLDSDETVSRLWYRWLH
jgi:hypothetical protein